MRVWSMNGGGGRVVGRLEAVERGRQGRGLACCLPSFPPAEHGPLPLRLASSPLSTCALTAVALLSSCGDGTCSSAENCVSCSEDCGECDGERPPCHPNSTFTSTPLSLTSASPLSHDCAPPVLAHPCLSSAVHHPAPLAGCGDGFCDRSNGESCGSCPGDCDFCEDDGEDLLFDDPFAPRPSSSSFPLASLTSFLRSTTTTVTTRVVSGASSAEEALASLLFGEQGPSSPSSSSSTWSTTLTSLSIFHRSSSLEQEVCCSGAEEAERVRRRLDPGVKRVKGEGLELLRLPADEVSSTPWR